MVTQPSNLSGELSKAPLKQAPYLRIHLEEPDFRRPLLDITAVQKRGILEKLQLLYGKRRAAACWPELERIMRVYYAHKTAEMIEDDNAFEAANRFTEKDVIAITYADAIFRPGKSQLHTLFDFLNLFLRRTINTLHILPFYPSSSDRGFSVMDYEAIDPQMGTWEDITRLSLGYRLMFDGVFNHVSSKSRWFQEFLNGNPEYENYFIIFSTKKSIDDDHLRLILRPRTSDLLTEVRTINGARYVWTTFSPDQIDLNFKNVRVLLKVIAVLLYYVRRGADIIRLDAVTYIWSDLGTSCAHLKQTHLLVKLFRSILDVVAPQVALVSETNVPHADNISYFGDGHDEAQMVYNFALPTLVLHAFYTGDCSYFSTWAATLEKASASATYLNILDTHDGIGVMGVRGILPEGEIRRILEEVVRHGGLISYRDNADGTVACYELNATWYSALNSEDGDEESDLQVDRFIASRSIALVLRGVPGIYLPSFLGSRNDRQAVCDGDPARSINRARIDEEALRDKLNDPHSSTYKTSRKFDDLLEKRTATPAFHPNADQRILRGNPAVFLVARESSSPRSLVICMTNVTARTQAVEVSIPEVDEHKLWRDLLSGKTFEFGAVLQVSLKPYEVMWLEPSGLSAG